MVRFDAVEALRNALGGIRILQRYRAQAARRQGARLPVIRCAQVILVFERILDAVLGVGEFDRSTALRVSIEPALIGLHDRRHQRRPLRDIDQSRVGVGEAVVVADDQHHRVGAGAGIGVGHAGAGRIIMGVAVAESPVAVGDGAAAVRRAVGEVYRQGRPIVGWRSGKERGRGRRGRRSRAQVPKLEAVQAVAAAKGIFQNRNSAAGVRDEGGEVNIVLILNPSRAIGRAIICRQGRAADDQRVGRIARIYRAAHGEGIVAAAAIAVDQIKVIGVAVGKTGDRESRKCAWIGGIAAAMSTVSIHARAE